MIYEPVVEKKLEKDNVICKFNYKHDAYKQSLFISKLTFLWSLNIINFAHLTILKSEYLGRLEWQNKSEVFERNRGYLE